MTTPKALICDLDMTLIDSKRDIAASVAWAATATGSGQITETDVYPWIGKGLRKMFDGLFPGREQKEYDALVRAYKDRFFDHCKIHSQLYPDVEMTLAALKEKGVLLAVATAKMTFMARRVCEAFELDRLLDHIQGTDNIPGKPDPAVVLAACDALKISPKDAVFVGDTIMDVEAGKAAGCYTVAMTYGISSRNDLTARKPDLMLDSFDLLAPLFKS